MPEYHELVTTWRSDQIISCITIPVSTPPNAQIWESATPGPVDFELLAREDEALLIGRDAFLVLDLRFHVINRVRQFTFQRDSFVHERLDEDLHATTQTNDKVRGDSFWML